MERNLHWTNRALKQLDEIANYIAIDNPTRATTFVKELQKKVDTLKQYQLGNTGRVFGTKEFVLHKNYLAVYRIKNNEVQILTILHTARK